MLGHSFTIPEKPTNYVNDYINLLSASEQAELNQLLKDFETQTSTQVYVAIFNTLEDESLEDVSMRLAEKWQTGQKGKDNGVILLLFMQDRKLRIEVGYGLEGVLTDAKAKRIIQEVIVPNFKNKQFYQGILQGLATILKLTHDEYQNDLVKSHAQRMNRNQGINIPIFFALIIGLFIFFHIFNFLRKMGYVTVGSGYHGGFSSGGYSSGSSWSSGGGGFSGGGGGSFGGGGSSGSW